MKRAIILVLFWACLIFIHAQSTMSNLYKQWMIEDINRGRYDMALQEIIRIENWDYNANLESSWINIGHALDFIKYAEMNGLNAAIKDSLASYIAVECETFAEYFFYSENNYNEALTYRKIACELRESSGILDENYLHSLIAIGDIYTELTDYDIAEKSYFEALEFIQQHEEQVFRIELANLFNNLGLLYVAGGHYLQAEEYYYKSLTILRDLYGEDNIELAATLNNLGNLFYELKDYVKAEKFYSNSLKIKKEKIGESHPDYASGLDNIALVYCGMGAYDRAKQLHLKAMDIRKNTLGENHPDYILSLHNTSMVYSCLNDIEKAEYYALEAYEKFKLLYGETNLHCARALNNIGVIYKNVGQYEKAESYYLQALKVTKEVLGEKSLDYVVLLTNIGDFYLCLGDISLAKDYELKALSIKKEILGENNISYAYTLNNLGNIYSAEGNIEKAEYYYISSLNVVENLYGSNNVHYAYPLHNLAGFYLDNELIIKAKSSYERVLTILENTLGKENSDYATTIENLGLVSLALGDFSTAEEYYLKALNILKNIYGINSIKYSSVINRLCCLYLKSKEYTEAEKYFFESQKLYKEDFINNTNFMDEVQREKYWNSIKEVFNIQYPMYAYLYYPTELSISRFIYDNEIFIKGLLLYSSLIIRRSIEESNDTTLINQWNELTTKKQQIQVLQEKEPQSDYLKQIQEEAEQLEKQITRSSAAYRENQAIWQITWDSVQNHLSANEVAIEYFSAPLSEDSTMYCALLLRHDSEYPELLPLFEEKEITTFLSSGSGNITNRTYDFYANGDSISQLVWSKILPYINEGETIYFAPSGLLHQLAIEYLPYDENRTMSDIYNMVRLSSTREIVLNKQDTEYTTATIYGGIAYDLEEDVLLAESENYATENLLASRSIENDTLNRGNVKYLPGTKKEAESINALLKQNNISAKLYTTAKANEESFKALSGKHSNILHIGTHGFTWTDSLAKKQDFFAQRVQLMGQEQHYDTSIDPLNRCGLLFAGANIALQGNSKNLPEGVQDGILTAKEISLMDLRDANLVVLSACETAKGDITSEGVFGLQRAFKMAGVQTIIMSLWKVNDHATQLLMTEFYNNWIGKHQSKREAFRNAQNAVRYAKDKDGDYKYNKPIYWAGFVMLD